MEDKKHLIVEKHHDYFVKVYWSDDPENIIWDGIESDWYESLKGFKAEDSTRFNIDLLMGYDIVYK